MFSLTIFVILFLVTLTQIDSYHVHVNAKKVSINHPTGRVAIFMAKKSDEDLETAFLPIESRKYRIGDKPASGFILGSTNFIKELKEIFGSINTFKGKSEPSLPESLKLKLSNVAVKEAEILRESRSGRVDASPVARLLYDVGCSFLDNFFDERPIARFWFLETGTSFIHGSHYNTCLTI